MKSQDHNFVWEAVIYLAGELEELQELFFYHPCKHHFKHGKPRLHTFTIEHKDVNMSASQTPAVTYLNSASTDFVVSAFDQYGFPYSGADLANTTVTTSNPANVGASLSSFTGSSATMTLAQAGGEGLSNITIANGTVTASLTVESYKPALTSFTIAPAPAPVAPAAPTPAPAVTTVPAATTPAVPTSTPAAAASAATATPTQTGTITNTGTITAAPTATTLLTPTGTITNTGTVA